MATYSWTCPFCQQPTTITQNDKFQDSSTLSIKNKHNDKKMFINWVVCPNPDCNEYSLWVSLYNYSSSTQHIGNFLQKWNLIPPAEMKAFPAYIPTVILEDYREACLIKDLSPKASATLARRCLQGMIRDFWKIKKRNLKLEIDALQNKLDKKIWKAIDAVRSIGNIGAHMEKSIDLIIEVEPEEAEMLIKLIEMLIKEWYIRRHEDEEMLTAIIAMKEQKETEKKIKQEALKLANVEKGIVSDGNNLG